MSQTEWDRFRVERISTATFLKRNLIHLELLLAALRRARGSVLEVGVGSGAQSSLLSRWVDRVVSVDNDRRIMSAAQPNVNRFGPELELIQADGFALPFGTASFGVAISQGLLEHFDDVSIGRLVREQLRVSRSIAFSVPSDNYPRQDVGDERLMPPLEWRRIIEGALEAGAYDVRARYYRFDPESAKYSALSRRRLGGFSVLVTVDPR